MSKLHELLAVNKTLNSQSDILQKESEKTFAKDSLFAGLHRTLTMFDAERENEGGVTDNQVVTTTVDENLKYLLPFVAKAWDAEASREKTNTTAMADVVVEGTVLLKDVPAQMLLALEANLAKIRRTYLQIKTTAPGINWIPADELRAGVMKFDKPEEAIKAETISEPVVLYEATKEHPAQVQIGQKRVAVGKYQKLEYTGLITPADKAARIARIDQLILAVKQAKQRANCATVIDVKVGKTLFNYINGADFI